MTSSIGKTDQVHICLHNITYGWYVLAIVPISRWWNLTEANNSIPELILNHTFHGLGNITKIIKEILDSFCQSYVLKKCQEFKISYLNLKKHKFNVPYWETVLFHTQIHFIMLHLVKIYWHVQKSVNNVFNVTIICLWLCMNERAPRQVNAPC